MRKRQKLRLVKMYERAYYNEPREIFLMLIKKITGRDTPF